MVQTCTSSPSRCAAATDSAVTIVDVLRSAAAPAARRPGGVHPASAPSRSRKTNSAASAAEQLVSMSGAAARMRVMIGACSAASSVRVARADGDRGRRAPHPRWRGSSCLTSMFSGTPGCAASSSSRVGIAMPAAAPGMCTVGVDEPVAGVERLHLGERALANRTRAVGGAVEHGVVEDDHVAVGGGVDVELEALGAGRQAGGERLQRVLGMRPRGTRGARRGAAAVPRGSASPTPSCNDVGRQRHRRRPIASPAGRASWRVTDGAHPVERAARGRTTGSSGSDLELHRIEVRRRPPPPRSAGAGRWRDRSSRRSRSPDPARPWRPPGCRGRSRSGGRTS